MTDAPQNFPPDEWFAAVADGAPQHVAFRDIHGGTELVEAVWLEENLFDIKGLPLLVDGVSLGDTVEVGWGEGGADPHFVRLSGEGWGYRTIRSSPSVKEFRQFLQACERFRIRCFRRHRYERGIFVAAVDPNALRSYREFDEDPCHVLPGDWVFTDTGKRDWP